MGIKKQTQIIVKIIETVIFVGLMIVLVVVALPLIPNNTVLSIHTVTTSSMTPTIPKGSVIFGKPYTNQSLKVGTIIIFAAPDNPKATVVHRIINSEMTGDQTFFKTKGDNNEVEDNWTITTTLIKSIYKGYIPYLGFVINWLQTVKGFVIGMGIPAILLIMLEIQKIKTGIHEEVKKQTQRALDVQQQTNILACLISVSIGGWLLCGAKPVYAYFSSTVQLTGMHLEVKATAPVITKGDVVINELMWPGSSVSGDDQWIELRNTTNHQIDISGWVIKSAGNNHEPNITLRDQATIPPQGFFLITKRKGNSSNSALAMQEDQQAENMQLTFNNCHTGGHKISLTNSDGEIIDEIITNPWPAGTLFPHRSMERNDEPGNGLDEKQWHTCMNTRCNSDQFWRIVSDNHGTPKATNSKNGGHQPKPHIHVHMDNQHHKFYVSIFRNDFSHQIKGDYNIRYRSDGIEQEISGTFAIKDNQYDFQQQIDIGTCSEDVCIYPETIEDPRLETHFTSDDDGGNFDMLETINEE